MTTAPECPRVDLTAEFLVDPYPAYDRGLEALPVRFTPVPVGAAAPPG